MTLLAKSSFPQTLLQFAGIDAAPATLDDAVLIMIDVQNEYRTGKLPLRGIDAAIAENRRLLAAARSRGTPIIHVVHHSAPGKALFDPETDAAGIIPDLVPLAGEPVIVKTLPNCFAGTALESVLKETFHKRGRSNAIMAGFATHMCVSATARAALDLNIPATVVASATASRDLPNPLGGVIQAEVVQETALAELADRFAAVVPDVDALCLSRSINL